MPEPIPLVLSIRHILLRDWIQRIHIAPSRGHFKNTPKAVAVEGENISLHISPFIHLLPEAVVLLHFLYTPN